MVITELSLDEWKEACETVEHKIIFASVEFIQAYAKGHKLGHRQIVLNKNSRPAILISFYCTKSKIINASGYLYNACWIDKALSDNAITDCLALLINYLKREFRAIQLKLSPEIIDVRPFVWNGFVSNIRYSYVKNLEAETGYHKNIDRILKTSIPGLCFKTNDFDEETKLFHAKDLHRYGLSKTNIDGIISTFQNLRFRGNILVINAYAENQIQCSTLIVLDKETKSAFLFLISRINDVNLYKAGSASHMYDFCFRQLRARGYKKVDLCGANMEHIARFKSKFGTESIVYFEVNYNRFLAPISRMKIILTKIKAYLIRYIFP